MVRRYNNEDFKAVKTWFKARNMDLIHGMLPKTGFIDPEVGAGFLISTDTSYCILEPFIANPDTDPELRDDVLKEVLSRLVIEAIRLGYKGIYGFSKNANMLKRAKEQGFIPLGQAHTVYKDLE